jgi:hypothetical protein
MVGTAHRITGGVAALVLCATLCLGEHPPAAPAEPQPAVRIAVAPLGYMPPGAFYLTYRLSSASLGFFDDDHLLFTFRMGGLLRRLPSDRDGDEDQQIRAVVLDVKTGKVVRQTEWRMHDRLQYVWPFPEGKFLVRIRNSLYLTDETLDLEPYLTFDSTVRAVEVSPDRRMLVVETDEPAMRHPTLGDAGVPGSEEAVRVGIYVSGTNRLLAGSEAKRPVLLPLMDDGLVDTLEGKRLGSWLLREVLFHGSARNLTEVKSTCQPSVQPVSATVTLVGGCFETADQRPIVAISTTSGKELWHDSWDNHFVWGWFDYAENGSRFAYESVHVNRPIGAFDGLYPDDVTAQLAGVFDTDTGKLVLVRDVSPVGRRFAVLRKGAIEVYDLPPVEAAKPAPEIKTPEAKRKK